MIPISSIMTKDVVVVKPDTLIFDALNLFMKHEISGLPVVDDQDGLVGILTEKDVLSLLLDHKVQTDAKVADYMSEDVVSFNETDDAVKVCQFFLKNSVRRVPILKERKLVGVVSRRDIVRLIIEMRNRMSDYRVS